MEVGSTNKSRQLKSTNRLSFVVASLVYTLIFLINPSPSLAALVKNCTPEQLKNNPESCANQLTDFEGIITTVIQALVSFAGIALFLMLVAGGIMYLSSGGSPEATQKARSTITYAIIGIALLILAWFALLFIEQFTGVQVSVFKIGL